MTLKGSTTSLSDININDDALHATDAFEYVLGISEGPIKGVKGETALEKSQNIFINDVPLTSISESPNFENADMLMRYEQGRNLTIIDDPEGQTPIFYVFGASATSISVGTDLVQNVPITRQTPGTFNGLFDVLEVRLLVRSLVKYTDTGTEDTEVEFKIEYRKNIVDEPWTWYTENTIKIKGKVLSGGFVRAYPVWVPDSASGYELRLTKVTPDSTDEELTDVTWLSYEISDTEPNPYTNTGVSFDDPKLDYHPNTAMLQIAAVLGEKLPAIPTVSAVFQGILCRVPSNYDPIAKTYDEGLPWDGTFKVDKEWTNNPFWLAFELITNVGFGMAKHNPYVNANKFKIYEMAKYADELVPDGKGGSQPRFTFNGILSQTNSGLETINYVLGTAFAAAYDNNDGEIIIIGDTNSPAKSFISPEMCIADSEGETVFTYSRSDITSRYNQIVGTYIEPSMEWEPQTLGPISDTDHIDRHGVNRYQYDASGCTNAHELTRKMTYILQSALNEVLSVEFKLPVSGIDFEPFDIINICDPNSGYGLTGRAVNVTATEIELRDPIYFEEIGEFKIFVKGKTSEQEVSYTNALVGYQKTIVFTGSFTDINDFDEFPPVLIEMENGAAGLAKPFRVTQITEDEEGGSSFTISAIEVDRNKHVASDNAVLTDAPKYSFKNEPTASPATNIQVAKEERVSTQYGQQINLWLTWDSQEQLAFGAYYEVSVVESGRTSKVHTLTTVNTFIEVPAVSFGQVVITVTSARGRSRITSAPVFWEVALLKIEDLQATPANFSLTDVGEFKPEGFEISSTAVFIHNTENTDHYAIDLIKGGDFRGVKYKFYDNQDPQNTVLLREVETGNGTYLLPRNFLPNVEASSFSSDLLIEIQVVDRAGGVYPTTPLEVTYSESSLTNPSALVLTEVRDGTRQFTASWASAYTDFQIQILDDTQKVVQTATTKTNSFDIKGLEEDSYTFKLKAFDGTRATSDWVSGAFSFTATTTPTSGVVTDSSLGKIEVHPPLPTAINATYEWKYFTSVDASVIQKGRSVDFLLTPVVDQVTYYIDYRLVTAEGEGVWQQVMLVGTDRLLYTWLAYADDNVGTGIDLDPTGKEYYGIATGRTTETPVLTPSLYKWIQREQGAAGAPGINPILDNKFYGASADFDGSNPDLSGAVATLKVLYGEVDDTAAWTITATPSAGITGTPSNNGETYTVTGMTVDQGYVVFSASRVDYPTLETRFNLAKLRDGESSTFYYIKYENGLSLHNGDGSLTLEARKVTGSGDVLAPNGTDPRLYIGATPYGNTLVLDTTNVTVSQLVELKEGATVLDSVTVIDVLDGSPATQGSVSHNNGLAFVQAKHEGAWSPAATDTTLTFTFYTDGVQVAQKTILITRSAAGILTASTQSVNADITIDATVGDGTQAITVTATHTPTSATVSERVQTVTGGDKGDKPVLGDDYLEGATGHFVSNAFILKDIGAADPALPTNSTWNGTTETAPDNSWSDERMDITTGKVRLITTRRYEETITYDAGVSTRSWNPIAGWSAAKIDALEGVAALGAIPGNISPAYVGGSSNFLISLNDNNDGGFNEGEITIRGSFFDHPDGTQRVVPPISIINTLFGETGGIAGRFFIIWSEVTLHTRFPDILAGMQDVHFIPIVYTGTKWQAIGNLNARQDVGTFLETDCFVAALEADNTTGLGITQMVSYVARKGDKPVLGEDYVDGESGDYFSYAFKLEDAGVTPATPDTGSLQDDPFVETPPTGWSLNRMDHSISQVRWMASTRYKRSTTYNNQVPTHTWSRYSNTWSPPVKDSIEGEKVVQPTLSNSTHTINADAQGAPVDFNNSGTVLNVWNGGTVLAHDVNEVGDANGTWALDGDPVATGGVIVGTKTHGAYSLTYGDITALTSDTGSITFTVKGLGFDGLAFSGVAITQTFNKSFQGSTYTLPTADSNTLGGVKVGTDLSITSEVLSINKSQNFAWSGNHNFNTNTLTNDAPANPFRISRWGNNSSELLDIWVEDFWTKFKHVGDENGEGGFAFYGDPLDAASTELLKFDMSSIWYKGQTIWHSGNDGAGSGLNADLLDGYNATKSTVVDTVAVRDSSGDINARLFRSEYDTTNPTVNFIMTQIDTVSNNYIRPTTPAQFRTSVTANYYPSMQGRVVTDCDTFTGSGMYGFDSYPANGTGKNYQAMIVARNSDVGLQIAGGHNHDELYFRGYSSSGDNWTPWRNVLHDGNFTTYAAEKDHVRAIPNRAYSAGTTTASLISDMEAQGYFDSTLSAGRSSWDYAGNSDLADAGRLTELAGMSFLTWTDNPDDATRGNITVLAVAPNTGGSAGKVFIYNDQGPSYSPGWREVWTSTSDGAGSGLDADLLDGLNSTDFAQLDQNQTVTGGWTFGPNQTFNGNVDVKGAINYKGAGHFYIDNDASNNHLYLRTTSDGSIETGLIVIGGSASYVQMYSNGEAVARTLDNGMRIGNDLATTGYVEVFHDSNNGIIRAQSGHLYLGAKQQAKNCYIQVLNSTGTETHYPVRAYGSDPLGYAALYCGTSEKFRTKSTGVNVIGELETDTFLIPAGATTIAGLTWANGWFKIGKANTTGAELGWAIDNNEIYNSNAGIIGTLVGPTGQTYNLTLSPSGSLVITSTARIDGDLNLKGQLNYTGAGDFYIDNEANGTEIFIRGRKSDGSVQNAILCVHGTGSNYVQLMYNGARVIQTEADGILVGGDMGSGYMRLRHNGLNGYIHNSVGDLWLYSDGAGDGVNIQVRNTDSSYNTPFAVVAGATTGTAYPTLRYGNTDKFKTTATGTTTTGSSYVTGDVNVDGDIKLKQQLRYNGASNFYIDNDVDDGNMYLRTSNAGAKDTQISMFAGTSPYVMFNYNNIGVARTLSQGMSFGTAVFSQNVSALHTGSNGYFSNSLGVLYIRNYSNGSPIYLTLDNSDGSNNTPFRVIAGATTGTSYVDLRYGDVGKLVTTGVGVQVTGKVDADTGEFGSASTTTTSLSVITNKLAFDISPSSTEASAFVQTGTAQVLFGKDSNGYPAIAGAGTDTAYNLSLNPTVGTVFVGGQLDVGTSVEASTFELRTDDAHNKIKLYGGGDAYCIGTASAQTYGWLNGWAVTFTTDDAAGKGFAWRDDTDTNADAAMTLTNAGELNVKSKLGFGGGTTDYMQKSSNLLQWVNSTGNVRFGRSGANAYFDSDGTLFDFTKSINTAGSISFAGDTTKSLSRSGDYLRWTNNTGYVQMGVSGDNYAYINSNAVSGFYFDNGAIFRDVVGNAELRIEAPSASTDEARLFLKSGSVNMNSFWRNSDKNFGFHIEGLTRLRYVHGTDNWHFSNSVSVQGLITADIVRETSDERVKSDFEPITDALAKTRQLDGETYLQDGSDERLAGIRAQLIEKVLPEAIGYTDDETLGKKLSVKVSALPALLVEAVKELADKNDALEARLERLEAIMEKLTNGIS